MPEIIGVRFRNVGKVYYFDPCEFTIHYHDHVIVETARGIEYGTVVITPTEVPEEKITGPLKKVLRMATEEDDIREKENREHEKEAYRICKQKIAERGLDMKLIEAEYTFDNSKVLFYFTADGRIDFRELVKDLAGIFRTRIELRQIGVRDETKLLGGIGSCGRPLCCHTWLSEFAPVSIKMAKDQNLSLNPTKISGTCGRLMCCLKNEADTYAYLNKGLPGKGDYVTTPEGLHGDVHSVNILRQTVKVIVDLGNDEKEMQEFDVKDITFIPKSKKPKKDQQKAKGEKDGKQEQKKEKGGRAKGQKDGQGVRDGQKMRDGQGGQAGRDGQSAQDARDGRDGQAVHDGQGAWNEQGAHEGRGGQGAHEGRDGRDAWNEQSARDGHDGHDAWDEQSARDGHGSQGEQTGSYPENDGRQGSGAGGEKRPRRQRNRRNNSGKPSPEGEHGAKKNTAAADPGTLSPEDAYIEDVIEDDAGSAAENHPSADGEKKKRRRRRPRRRGQRGDSADKGAANPAAEPGSADRELTEGE